MLETLIDEETATLIKRDLEYSEEDLVKIAAVRVAIYNGFPLRIPDSDKWMWTSEKGIAHQLSMFTHACGLVYWFAISGGRCKLEFKVVNRPAEIATGVAALVD